MLIDINLWDWVLSEIIVNPSLIVKNALWDFIVTLCRKCFLIVLIFFILGEDYEWLPEEVKNNWWPTKV